MQNLKLCHNRQMFYLLKILFEFSAKESQGKFISIKQISTILSKDKSNIVQ